MFTNSAIYVGHDITIIRRIWSLLSDLSYFAGHGYFISFVEFVGAVLQLQAINILLSRIRHMLWRCRGATTMHHAELVDTPSTLAASCRYTAQMMAQMFVVGAGVHGRQSRPANCVAGARLSLLVQSIPVYAACVWRRPLNADVGQGPPADERPTQLRSLPEWSHCRTWIHSWTITSPPEFRFGAPQFTWLASILLHDQCLASLLSRNMSFWPHYVICAVLGMIIWSVSE